MKVGGKNLSGENCQFVIIKWTLTEHSSLTANTKHALSDCNSIAVTSGLEPVWSHTHTHNAELIGVEWDAVTSGYHFHTCTWLLAALPVSDSRHEDLLQITRLVADQTEASPANYTFSRFLMCEWNQQALISNHEIKRHLDSNAPGAPLRTSQNHCFAVTALHLQFCSTTSWSLDGFWWSQFSSSSLHTSVLSEQHRCRTQSTYVWHQNIDLSSFWTVYFNRFVI